MLPLLQPMCSNMQPLCKNIQPTYRLPFVNILSSTSTTYRQQIANISPKDCQRLANASPIIVNLSSTYCLHIVNISANIVNRSSTSRHNYKLIAQTSSTYLQHIAKHWNSDGHRATTNHPTSCPGPSCPGQLEMRTTRNEPTVYIYIYIAKYQFAK